MTEATQGLINELSEIIDENKYVILSGATAVGKTYIATAVAENCLRPEYNSQGVLPKGMNAYDSELELITIHPSYSYEDFVSGISIQTENGQVVFRYEDKIFLAALKRANKSWQEKANKKYFLILDDIGRGQISGIMGNILPLIEPHGNSLYKVNVNDEAVWVSPNVYIIATRSTTVDTVEQFNYGFFRHFYERTIDNDFSYMSDDASGTYTDYDITANAMYYRSRRIVMDNLRHRYQMSASERNKYVIGHGVYKESGTTMIVRYQVIPLLRQYVKDGILDKTARTSIDTLQKLVGGKYSKDISLADVGRIIIRKEGVTSETFRNEGLTH